MNDDRYKNTVAYPDIPGMARGLRKIIAETPMTQGERDDALAGVAKMSREKCQPQMDLYNKEQGRIHDLFRADMVEQFKLGRFPQEVQDLMHAAAYERGHSGGFAEVENCYYQVVEWGNQIFEAGVAEGYKQVGESDSHPRRP